ncbi:hypothetical protein VTN77DRAFT_4965 [Rasamsonia byssochlamydoides]|uniref:uncharacterized protein n=1 Tax=Rasamsonia byssochlamydoides TaxID=89139 RepID=UPI0037430F30
MGMIIKLLLANTAVDPDSKDDYGWTPLFRAATNAHQAIVKFLLATGRVDPNVKAHLGPFTGARRRLAKTYSIGWTPLSLAVEYSHEAVVKLLLGVVRVNLDLKAAINSSRKCGFKIREIVPEGYELP